ncbi:MAG TPA: BrnT family toxin [Rhizomicrobium sp.]
MDFEFDPAKSAANKAKHGIDFEQAREIWSDDNRLEIAAASETENRHAITGMIGDVCWTAIVTYRADRIRIISVRRARTVEIENYHSG